MEFFQNPTSAFYYLMNLRINKPVLSISFPTYTFSSTCIFIPSTDISKCSTDSYYFVHSYRYIVTFQTAVRRPDSLCFLNTVLVRIDLSLRPADGSPVD